MLAHWQEAFLTALRRTGNVSRAAELSGKCRAVVYYHRRRNRKFRRAWDGAIHFYSEENVKRAISGSKAL